MALGGSIVDPAFPAVVRAPLSAPYIDTHNTANQRPNTKLPRLHWCAYKGDLQGVLHCITDGCSLHETVSLRNQHGRLVCGITALFLSAQRGHTEIVKLLVTNGASPMQPCYIQGSTELCTPAEVASLNLHFKLARWLKNAARAQRKEDEVLALDDGERMSQISGRLIRGLLRARSVRSVGASPVNMGGRFSNALVRMSRGSHGVGRMSVDGAPAASVASLSQLGYGPPEPVDAEADAQRLAALNFMQNVDLAEFDPDAGDAAPVVVPGITRSPDGPVKKLLRRILPWGGGNGGLGGTVRASASQRVREGNGVGAGGGALRGLALDAEAVDPTRPDHTKVLQRFLKDLDLAHWQPEADSPLERLERTTQGGASTRPASPNRGRTTASPPRSARSSTSPQRTRP